jgi:FkbM family methyltransferase
MSNDRESLQQEFDGLLEFVYLPRWEKIRRSPVRSLSRSICWRWLASRFAFPLKLKAQTFFGYPMTVLAPPYADILFYGAYLLGPEIRLTRHFLHQIQEGQVFFDVGAHIGYYALLASRLVGPSGRVLAFEPAPPVLPVLRDNIQKHLNITLIEAAAGDRDGSTDLWVPKLKDTGMSTVLKNGPGVPCVRYGVQSVTLDTICSTYRIQPAWIKLDVEGAEDRVILGSPKTFSNSALTVVVEVWVDSILPSHRESVRLLSREGFKPYSIMDDGNLRMIDSLELFARECLSLRRQAVESKRPSLPRSLFENLVFKRD